MTARSQQVLTTANACDSCYGSDTNRVRQADSQPASQPEVEGATDASQSQLVEARPGDGGWC